MALSCRPKILLADEPTTSLDVTIQAQIIDLMLDLKEVTGTAVVLISHDLGLVAETCQRVVVMYAGRAVEEASVKTIFKYPLHPYTIGLLNSIPRLRTTPLDGRRRRLEAIPGVVPSLHRLPGGCAFNPRCPRSVDACSQEMPPFREAHPGHYVSCWLHAKGNGESRNNAADLQDLS
jgi:peptide/nickel transport system ATP-binding protein